MVLFASFLSPRMDASLRPLWIDYYKRFKFDAYTAIVHDTGCTRLQVRECEAQLRSAGFTTEHVEGEYMNGALQECALTSLRRRFDPNDTMVIADSDEFHDFGVSEYARVLTRFDYVRGELIDRWDSTLHPVNHTFPLDKQYPRSGNIFDVIRQELGLKGGNWEFNVTRSKILASRMWMPVKLNGSHVFSAGMVSTARIASGAGKMSISGLEGVAVNHYTWTPGIVQRQLSRTYVPIWWTGAFIRYFGLGPDDPASLAWKEESEKRSSAMGWVPA